MRDLIVCLTAVMILGGGLSMGRHYLANQEHERALQVADYHPLTWKELQTAPVLQQPTAVAVASQEKPAPKANVQPSLSAEKPGKAAAQPALEPAPVLVQTAPAKPEKKMIGPDGVAFVRTAPGATKPVVVVRANRPVAPEALGLEEQAKASAIQTVVERVPAPTPEPTVVAAATPQIAQLLPTKTAGLMVGPDGVVYQHVRAVTPR